MSDAQLVLIVASILVAPLPQLIASAQSTHTVLTLPLPPHALPAPPILLPLLERLLEVLPKIVAFAMLAFLEMPVPP